MIIHRASKWFAAWLPTCRAMLFLAIASACPTATLASKPPDSTSSARAIESLERDNPEYLYDMHGNANTALRALMLSRFSATREMIRAIDRLESKKDKKLLVAALYKLIAFVKDPGSIDWLRRKIANKDTKEFYENWLPEWTLTFDGIGVWPWLEGRAHWIEFFVDTFKREASGIRRAEILYVLSGFDDAAVVGFFQEQAQATLGARETLLVARYIAAHGGNADTKKIEKAIASLSSKPEDRQFMVELAYTFRHEAFVPFLIDTLDAPTKAYSRESSWNPQDALEQITFDFDVHGKVAWKRWFAQHGAMGRVAWRDRAIREFRRRLAMDEKAALLVFQKAVYRWNDIMFLSFIETELANRQAFQSEIAGWINLTYAPIYRNQLAPLARSITTNTRTLETWARDLLIERDFLPGRKQRTWEQEVQISNSAV